MLAMVSSPNKPGSEPISPDIARIVTRLWPVHHGSPESVIPATVAT